MSRYVGRYFEFEKDSEDRLSFPVISNKKSREELLIEFVECAREAFNHNEKSFTFSNKEFQTTYFIWYDIMTGELFEYFDAIEFVTVDQWFDTCCEDEDENENRG